MTEPTPEQLWDLIPEAWTMTIETAQGVKAIVLCNVEDFARVVLAKWGTPAPVGAEPVAWYEYNADLDAWFLAYSHNPKAKTRPLVFGDATPQPTQAQAGAVPLTPEQIKDEASHHGFIGSTEMLVKFVRGVEAARGIKGGQHDQL